MPHSPGHEDIVVTIVEGRGRPGGEHEGYAFDISKAYGGKWYEKFRPPLGGPSIVQFAKTHNVHPVDLLIALVSLHGVKPPSNERMLEVAAALSERKAAQTISQWLKEFDPERWEANKAGGRGRSYLPRDIIGSTVNVAQGRGYVVQTVSPDTGGAASRRAFFDRISPNWENQMAAIKAIASENFEISATDTRKNVGVNNLFAVLWSLGWTPKQAKQDLEGNAGNEIRKVAGRLATKPTDLSLNSWFTSVYGSGDEKRQKPERLLRGVTEGREAGKSKLEKRADVLVDVDQDNPIIFWTGTGTEVRQSDYNTLFTKYSTMTRWYLDRDPLQGEIENWVNTGVSDYQLSVRLTKDPRFFRSPAWKSGSLEYKSTFRKTVSAEGKLPKQLIRKAIVNDWSPGAFYEALRGTPEYLEGNEFQGQVANLQGLYTEVQGGTITSGVKTALKEAAVARWSDDQFKSWLRAQPEYETGREHTKKVQGLNAVFAAFSGTSLKRVEVPVPEPVAAFDLPDSDRIFGEGDLSQDIDVRPAESVANPRGEVA